MQALVYNLLNKFFMNQIENEILKHLNKENKIIFDVGCFRGNFTTNIIKHENEKSKNTTFFLFDPNPNVKNYLNEILKNKNVKYFCLAFDNTDSKKKFYLNKFFEPSGSSLNTIHKDDRKWTNTRKCFMQLFHPFKKLKEFEEIMVETKSIDVFCRENHINYIDLLKLDTEGNEFNVLNGAKTILSKNKINVIYTEIIETKENYNKKNDLFVNYLNKHGFKLKVSLPIRSFSFMSNLKGTDNLFINENFKN
jgi:FkbM family methyltransferase